MSKPIKDYTLGEVKELCKESIGVVCNCPLEAWCERYSRRAPECWDLSEPLRWTQEEAEMAKAIKLLYGAPYLRRTSPCGYLVTTNVEHSETSCVGDVAWYLPTKLFPSLKPGETVMLEEIINSGQGERK